MKINDLQDGQVVTLRKGMAGRHDVDWNAWEDAKLYVQKNKKGEIVIVAIDIKDGNWAEYSPNQDYQGNGIFTAEDYYMEIQGLE